jgi:tryptophanyl-tRNA synthetase
MTAEDRQAEIRQGCTSAGLGCVDCKKILLESLERFLTPIHERRRELESRPDTVWDILRDGNARAREEAERTMEGVRQRLSFDF